MKILELRRRKRERGQSMIEFALVVPSFLLITFGIITFAWLIFQQQSVDNSAREAVRAASIMDPLFDNGTSTCSTKYGEATVAEAAPDATIEAAAAGGSVLVPINSSQLCASAATSTSMTSSATQTGNATITVTGSPTLATATSITVTVTYTAHPLSPFISAAALTLASSATETIQT